MRFKSKPKVNEKSKLKHELVQKHPQNDAKIATAKWQIGNYARL